MSESTPQKRARTESLSEDDRRTLLEYLQERVRRHREAHPHPDLKFWFEDGTIILKAQSTIFKVYKGVLAQHSPVFKDMFLLPQPEEAPSGPVTVPLFDSADDVRSLLNALMPRRNVCLSDIPDTSCDEVCACLRMAHKYQMDQLLEMSLRSLRKYYPDTYKLFKDRSRPLPFKLARAISVVNLARRVEAPTLLPMAIAECCMLGSEIVKGYERPDGIEEQLSLPDIGLCFQAKDKLIEARVRAFHRLFEPQVRQGCTAPDADNTYFNCLYFDIRNGVVPGLYTPNVWDSFSIHLSRYSRICESCKQAFAAEEVAQRKIIFDVLPTLVGVSVERWGTPPTPRWRPCMNNIFKGHRCGDQCWHSRRS